MCDNYIWTTRSISKATIIIGIHFVVFFFSILLSENYNYISSILLICWSICTYIFHEKKTDDIIDPVAVFSGIWIFSVGLAQLRLSKLQTPWLISVWLTFMLVPIIFWLTFSITQNKLLKKNNKMPIALSHWKKKHKYARLLILFGFFCLILLILQYQIKGYFPAFTKDVKARFDFYTKLIVLIVGTQAFIPMIIKCLYENKIKMWEKNLLLLASIIIFSSTILRVSRGDSLITAIIAIPILVKCLENKYINKYDVKKGKQRFNKKIIRLLFLVIGLFVISSSLRADNATDLKSAFLLPNFNNKLLDSKFFSYFYIYIANGIENFNFEVANCKVFSNGLRQLSPIAPFFPALKETINSLPKYVTAYSTTTCIIKDFYLDFGYFGVFGGMILFGMLIGFTHYLFLTSNDIMVSSLYGIGFSMCVLCFFDAWLSFFTIWLLYGFVFFIWFLHKLKLY